LRGGRGKGEKRKGEKEMGGRREKRKARDRK